MASHCWASANRAGFPVIARFASQDSQASLTARNVVAFAGPAVFLCVTFREIATLNKAIYKMFAQGLVAFQMAGKFRGKLVPVNREVINNAAIARQQLSPLRLSYRRSRRPNKECRLKLLPNKMESP